MNKICTSIEQSERLIELGIDVSTADMYWEYDFTEHECVLKIMDNNFDDNCIPAWSLSALFEQLPYELCDDDGNSCYLRIYKEYGDEYKLEYTDPNGEFESIETNGYEHFVDACYEMIVKLKENGKI